MTDAHDITHALLPIVMGVTGHRDIQDPEQIRTVLDRAIKNIRDMYPSTPLVALSALAEGADRLFARAVLDAHIPLYVPLPFSAEEYEKDFPDSVDAFRALCREAEAVFPIPWAPGVAPSDIMMAPGATPPAQRDWQYALAGIYLAQRSHILFALWDGQEARGTGGTAQIVHYRVHGHLDAQGWSEDDRLLMQSVAPTSLLDEPEPSGVCHVRVRRQGAPPVPEGVSAVWIPAGGPDYESLHRLNDYNRRARGLMKKSSPDSPNSSECSDSSSQPTVVEQESAKLTRKYTIADALAKSEIQDLRTHFQYIFWMAGGMIVSHELYVEGQPIWAWLPNWVWLLVYLLLLTGIGWQVWRMRHHQKTAEAVDDRALAEGLRVQRAWFRAGLPDLVSQRYLRRYSEGLGWIRQALRGTSLAYHADAKTADIQRVDTCWVQDQRDYYAGSVKRRGAVVRPLSRASVVFFAAGVILVLVTLPIRIVDWMPQYSVLPRVLDFLIGLFPAVAGLLSGYLEFAAYEDDIREHERAHGLFARASHKLAGDYPLSEKQTLIRELGIEVLIEHANWAILHKNHDAKAPSG
jgi:hypothetical protein